MANAAPQMSITQANSLAEQVIFANSVEAVQKLTTGVGSYNPANNPVITITPLFAGLIKGFYLKVNATINNTEASGGASLTLSPFGLSNIFSQIVFTDANSYQRINTDGFHLALLNTVRFGNPLGATRTLDNIDAQYGANFNNVVAPATIAAGASANVQFYLYIPLAYSDSDLRGAVYGNIINSAMSLQLSVNNNAISSSTTLQPTAAYYGATGNISNITITGWQSYLLNLPAYSTAFPASFNANGVLVPALDVNTYYQLIKSYPQLQLTANSDSLLPYAPQRSYLSTLLAYINGTQLNAGSDINYINIESANLFPFLQATPSLLSLITENKMHFDLPPAIYYLNRRHSPINTANYGNMYIKFNPSIVNSGAQIIQYDEFFSYAGVTNSAQAIGTGA